VGLSGPNTGSSATTLSSAYDYGYNAVGWTTGMTWTVNGAITSTQIAHDSQGRVTRWAGQINGPETWAYDGNGNIVTNTEYLEGMQMAALTAALTATLNGDGSSKSMGSYTHRCRCDRAPFPPAGSADKRTQPFMSAWTDYVLAGSGDTPPLPLDNLRQMAQAMSPPRPRRRTACAPRPLWRRAPGVCACDR